MHDCSVQNIENVICTLYSAGMYILYMKCAQLLVVNGHSWLCTMKQHYNIQGNVEASSDDLMVDLVCLSISPWCMLEFGLVTVLCARKLT